MADDLSFDDLIPSSPAQSAPATPARSDLSFDDLIPSAPARAGDIGMPTTAQRTPIVRNGRQVWPPPDVTSGKPVDWTGGAGRAGPAPAVAPEDPIPVPPVRPEGLGRLDTGANVPETPQTQAAQQQAVAEGRRAVVMFPKGSDEQPLAPGMARVRTPRGTFHFDPKQITPQQIRRASRDGRENEILGLGPYSKEDVQKRLHGGEPAIAVTERQPDGTEVKAAVGTPSTAPDQQQAVAAGAAPGNSVQVEPIEGVINGRFANGLPAPPVRPAGLGAPLPQQQVGENILDDPGPARNAGSVLSSIIGQQTGMLTGDEAYAQYQQKVAEAEQAVERARQKERDLNAQMNPGPDASPDEKYQAREMRRALRRSPKDRNFVTAARQETLAAESALTTIKRQGAPTQGALRSGVEAFPQAVGTQVLDTASAATRIIDKVFEPLDRIIGYTPEQIAQNRKETEGAFQRYRDNVGSWFRADATRSEELGQKVVHGVASTATFAATGLAGRALNLSPKAVTAIAGALPAAEQAWQHAERMSQVDSNVTEWRKWAMFLAGAGGGATEAIPLGRAFERLERASGGGVTRYLGAIAASMGEEGLQEGVQQLINNAAERGLLDPNANITKDVVENVIVGALSGALVTGALATGRLRPSAAVSGRIPGVPLPEEPAELDRMLRDGIEGVRGRNTTTGTSPAPQMQVPPGASISTPMQRGKAPDQSPQQQRESIQESQQQIGTQPVETDGGTPPESSQKPGSESPPASAPSAIEDTPANRILRSAGYGPEIIAEMSPRQIEAALQEAADEGIVDPGPGKVSLDIPQQQEDAPAPATTDAGTRAKPVTVTQSGAEIAPAAERVNVEPSEAQKAAGNYQKGHIRYDGLNVTIENPAGSTRSGADTDGEAWSVTMPAHYGYIKGSTGKDGDQVDVFLGQGQPNGRVFVIDQYDPKTGKFDEHKVVMGVGSQQEAEAIYRGAYPNDADKRLGAITEMTVADFRDRLAKGQLKKAFGKKPAIAQEAGQQTPDSAKPAVWSKMTIAARVALLKNVGLEGTVSPRAKWESLSAERQAEISPWLSDTGARAAQSEQIVPPAAAQSEHNAVLTDALRKTLEGFGVPTDSLPPAFLARAADLMASGERVGDAMLQAAEEMSDNPNLWDVAADVKVADEERRAAERRAQQEAQPKAQKGKKNGKTPAGTAGAAPKQAAASPSAEASQAAGPDAPQSGAGRPAAEAADGRDQAPRGSRPERDRPAGEGAISENGAKPEGDAAARSGREDSSASPAEGQEDRAALKDDFDQAFDEAIDSAYGKDEPKAEPAPAAKEKPAKKPKKSSSKKTAPRNEPSPEPKWRRIGVNSRGNPVYEDEQGVRSYTDGGFRFTEAVGIVPGVGIEVGRNRSKEYEPVETAANAAKSAGSNALQGADAAIAGLAKLFGGPGKMSSGLSFDEDTWKQAKPLFIEAAKKFSDAAGDVRKFLKLLIQELKDSYGFDAASMQRMRPYVRRLIDDVDSGAISLAGRAEQEKQQAEGLAGPAQSLEAAFSQHFLAGHGFRTIVEARKFAVEQGGEGLNPKQIEEAIETGVVLAARSIIEQGKPAADTYDALVDLYARQPRLATRTGTSVADQAYSTPAPLAYLAARAAQIGPETTVFEPSAGNGMLLMTAAEKNAVANEKNADRLATLKSMGFKVLNADASDPVTVQQAIADNGSKFFDAMIANPPFGVVKKDGQSVSFDMSFVQPGYRTNEIDHAISLRALEGMKPDGSAVLILGGINKLAKTEEARSDAYNGKAKREFYKTLYDNYNVVDHYTVAGELYERQGAGYPVDVIVIRGYGKSARKLPAADVPVVYSSWDALREKLDVDYPSATAPGDRQPRAADARTDDAGRAAGGDAGNPRSDAGLPDGGPGNVEPGPVRGGSVRGQSRLPAPDGRLRPDAGARAQRREPGRPGPAPSAEQRGVGTEKETEGQVSYKPQSSADAMGTLVPANMRTAISNALANIAEEHGSLDFFVADRLAMTEGDVAKYFKAEQIDALALALNQIEKGAGFIIGDQTGIGKGRVNAAIIRYAINQGLTPIFVTEKPGLYGDMYRDLSDTGIQDFLERDINILMTNAGESIPLDDEGKKVLKSGSSGAHTKLMLEIANNGELGEKYDALFTTYNQMQTVKGERTTRHTLLDSLISNAVLILDESHNAGGTEAGDFAKKAGAAPSRAEFVRQLVSRAQAVFYSSATYAKRPSVMDLYSRTDMAKAVPSIDALAGAIAKGGVPMQQVVAAGLAEGGQYIRRERSFAGVTYNTPVVDTNMEAYEAMAQAFMAVHKFSKMVEASTKALAKQMKEDAKRIGPDGSTGGAGASSTNFTSTLHNLVNQMLLSLKAPVAAQMAIEALQKGQRPVLTVSNTMGSFLKEFAQDNDISPGDAVNITFRDLLRRYLDRTRTITIKQPFSKEPAERKYLSDEDLGPAGLAVYKRAEAIIMDAPIGDMPISPIDFIHAELRKAGYNSGEITGRSERIDYSSGTPTFQVRPQADTKTAGRRKAIAAFQSGEMDAIILNQAGSTGLSLHADVRARDQRQRHMLIVQPEGNIDTHMQMLGRVHRTGQVIAPEYSQIIANIPAEKRPAAVLAKKMASLNASTTASRGGALTAKDTPDFMNEYGDRVVMELMQENFDLHEMIGTPVKFENGPEGAARTVTGRIPLLPVADQTKLYDLIEETYKAYLEEKIAAGENALEAANLNLDAKPISQKVLAEGTGTSPFTKAVVAETLDVKKQGKPYKADDLLKSIATGMKAEESGDLALLQMAGLDYSNKLMAKGNADFATYRKDYVGSIEGDQKLAQANAKLDLNEQKFARIMGAVPPGQIVSVSSEEGAFTGIVVKVGKSGTTQNPLALGSWKVTIAPPGQSPLNLSFTRLDTFEDAEQPEGQMVIKPVRDNPQRMLELFDQAAAHAREQRVMLTGNILKAYDFSGRRGQIVNYTTSGGELRQGILMPAGVKTVEDVVKDKGKPLGTVKAVIEYLKENGSVSTHDGVSINYYSGQRGLAVSVPGSKARGGKYFLNDRVREILSREGQDFFKRGDKMTGRVEETANHDAMIEALMNAGAMFERPFDLGKDASDAPTTAAPIPPRAAPAASPAARSDGLTQQAVDAGLDRAVVEAIGREAMWRILGPVAEHVRIEIEDRLATSADVGWAEAGTEALGLYHFGERLIQLSLANMRYGTTHEVAAHEIFHFMQHYGFFSEREIAVMRRELPRMRGIVARWYGDAAQSMDLTETTAQVFGRYYDALDRRERGLPPVHSVFRRIFDRLAAVLRRIRNWMDGLGFETAEDVFERAASGQTAETAIDTARDTGRPPGPDMFQRNGPPVPQRGSAAAPLRRRPEDRSLASMAVEGLADRFVRFRELQSRLQRDAGIVPADVHGALGALNTRISERIETFEMDEMSPALDLVEAAGGQERVNRFLYSRHAPERNAHIASINPMMPDGGSGMMTAAALAEQAAFQADPKLPDLIAAADAIYAMNARDLDRREAAGLIDAKTANAYRTQFQFYVPLRGFAGDEWLDDNGSGPGVAVVGPESKMASGRKSEADDIVSQTVNKSLQGFVRIEKNLVDRRVARLAQQMEAHYGANSPMAMRTQPPMVQTTGSVPVSMRRLTHAEYGGRLDVLGFKIGGKQAWVEFSGQNELVDELKNAAFDKMRLPVRAMMAVTQFYSRMRTSWNVLFPPINFIRDNEDAMIAATAMIGKGSKRAYMKALPAAINESFRYVFLGQRRPQFEAFRHRGGKMSFAKLRTLDEIKARIDRELNGAPLAMRPFIGIKNFLENWNDFFENVVRFALYKASLDKGQTPDKAVKVALEGTLNFHRRGTSTQILRAIVPFLNPSIQSPLRAGRLIVDAGGLNTATGRTAIAVGALRGVRRTYASLAVIGFAISVWNYMMGGDDDDGEKFWDKAQADYRDEKNILIYTGGRDEKGKPNAMMIPAFPEIMFPYKIGVAAAAALLGKRGAWDIAKDVGKAAYGLSPTEGRGMFTSGRMFIPQPLGMAVDIYNNRNWLENRIHPEPSYAQRGAPKHLIHWPSTEQTFVDAAKALHKAGVANLHPEDVRYLAREILGGYYQIADWAGGSDRGFPLANRLYANGSELHRRFETDRLAKVQAEANTRAAEARAARKANPSAPLPAGVIVGPRNGIQTQEGNVLAQMQRQTKPLYDRMVKARKDGNVAEAKRLQGEIDNVRKRFRIQAEKSRPKASTAP